jgi:DNA-binding transcriptional LysR family regulator
VRVIEAGSFTAAARTLGVPVSSVSRAVSNLEAELGARLLVRTTRKLSLTDGGQQFFQRMQTVIAAAHEATEAVTGTASAPRGVVRITAAPGLGGRHLPEIVGRIVQRYPDVVIELRLTNRLVDLVGDGIDLAIRAGVLQDSSLVARKVAVSELGVFAAPSYLARRGRPRRPADLSRHDCLAYGGREGKLPWRLAGPHGDQTVAVSGPIVCDDMGFLRTAILAGLGLAMLPAEMVVDDVRAGDLVRVLPRHGYGGGGIFVMWPSHKLVPARVVAVRERLIEELTALYA